MRTKIAGMDAAIRKNVPRGNGEGTKQGGGGAEGSYQPWDSLWLAAGERATYSYAGIGILRSKRIIV